jgi:predicted permease
MVTARLRDGVSLPQATASMTALGTRLAREFPDDDPGRGISVVRSDAILIHPQFDGILNYGASSLMIVVGLLLAIACTNLATWLLVRGSSRARELSVRLALGATRWQLVRHLLMESSLLAGVGGAVGCILAVWGIRLVALMDLPINAGVAGLDYRVLGFTLLVSLCTGVAFGLAPALGATRATLTPALRAEGDDLPPGRRGFTLRNVLLASQVALSCVLLVWGGVFVQRLAAGQTADLGFSTDGLAFVETDASFAGYEADEAAVLYGRLRDRIAALPGVESASLTAAPPPAWSGSTGELVIDGSAPADEGGTAVLWAWAGPGYFSTLRIPLLHGRAFTEFDRSETPLVAVLNESLARRYFGTSNAVGRRFRLAGAPGATSPAGGFEVIGVVPNTRTSVFDEGRRPLFYRSVGQAPATTATVIIRTSLEPASLLPSVQRVVRNLDGELPIITATTMTQHIADSLGVERAAATSLGGLGALGLGLASLGVYAVVAFAVSRRTREIGIRMALGAQRTQVTWTVSRNAATLLGVGVVTGLGLSWLSVQWSASMASSLSQGGGVGLFVPTADPLTFVLVAVLMAAVGLAATFFPARRAARVDPLVALRHL